MAVVAIIHESSGLVAGAAAVAFLLIVQLFAVLTWARRQRTSGRKAIAIGGAVMSITGAILVLTGFAIAILCNANIDLLDICSYPATGHFICHQLGPVLFLLGLIASVAERHSRAVAGGAPATGSAGEI